MMEEPRFRCGQAACVRDVDVVGKRVLTCLWACNHCSTAHRPALALAPAPFLFGVRLASM